MNWKNESINPIAMPSTVENDDHGRRLFQLIKRRPRDFTAARCRTSRKNWMNRAMRPRGRTSGFPAPVMTSLPLLHSLCACCLLQPRQTSSTRPLGVLRRFFVVK